MGIGWLWHFTDRGGDDALRANNERRAAAIHARWRPLGAVLDDAARGGLGRWRDARRRRAGLRELAALSDELLDDVGLLRDGSGRLAATSRARGRDLARALGDGAPTDIVRPFEPRRAADEPEAATSCAPTGDPGHRRAA